jgi:hypothetical protein
VLGKISFLIPRNYTSHPRLCRTEFGKRLVDHICPQRLRRHSSEARGRERETVVDADDGRDVRREFLAEPLGETAPRPVPPRARWGLNLTRRAGALGNVNLEPLATGVERLRAEGR